jgi:hypothetical protein
MQLPLELAVGIEPSVLRTNPPACCRTPDLLGQSYATERPGTERELRHHARVHDICSKRLGEILRRMTARKGETIKVLMPGYIGQNDKEGSGVFDPVRAIQPEVQFYALDRNLVPDVHGIERSIAAGGIDVLLIIHYFGFVTVDLERLKKHCVKNGVVLVEDCAHCCLLHESPHGTIGDYSFYSLHKFFPTVTGGVLRQNNATQGVASGDQRAALQGEMDPCDREVLEQLHCIDFDAANRKRRANYEFLADALGKTPGMRVLWDLDETTFPHNFPILIDNGRREKLYFHLQEHGLVTIALYYRLIDELDRDEHPACFEISSSILNLPVHQDTSEADLVPLVTEIERFLKS